MYDLISEPINPLLSGWNPVDNIVRIKLILGFFRYDVVGVAVLFGVTGLDYFIVVMLVAMGIWICLWLLWWN